MSGVQTYASDCFSFLQLVWVDAFIRAGAAPKVILETVRCWLEEGENSNSIDVIIFSMPQSADLLQLMELYFPLTERVSEVSQVCGSTLCPPFVLEILVC